MLARLMTAMSIWSAARAINLPKLLAKGISPAAAQPAARPIMFCCDLALEERDPAASEGRQRLSWKHRRQLTTRGSARQGRAAAPNARLVASFFLSGLSRSARSSAS